MRWVCGKPCRSTIGLPEPPTATLSATPSAAVTRRVVNPVIEGVMAGSLRTADQPLVSGRSASTVLAVAVSFRVLGPLEASDERGPVDLKGLRHRAVLARLLIARGQVVPVSRLVDDLWPEAPDG